LGRKEPDCYEGFKSAQDRNRKGCGLEKKAESISPCRNKVGGSLEEKEKEGGADCPLAEEPA